MNNYTIEEVLTHTAPMILIDKLIQYDDDSAECEVCITPQSAFYNTQRQAVPSYVGIEYMAQSISACAGAGDIDTQRTKKIGFLLGSRKYQTHTSWFNNGDVLRVHIARLHQEDSGLGVFECRIERDSEIVAEARVNVFQPQQDNQIL